MTSFSTMAYYLSLLNVTILSKQEIYIASTMHSRPIIQSSAISWKSDSMINDILIPAKWNDCQPMSIHTHQYYQKCLLFNIIELSVAEPEIKVHWVDKAK